MLTRDIVLTVLADIYTRIINHGCTNPGRQVVWVTKFFYRSAKYLSVLIVAELASYHPCGAYCFQVAPRFSEISPTPVLNYKRLSCSAVFVSRLLECMVALTCGQLI
jgi:hypothetical protein